MSYTVLVVDDDPDDLEITRRALAKNGCGMTCMTACRGEEALALLRGCADLPSIILLDLKMPGMNGIDTLRTIRSDNRLEHIPVVIVTNSTLESDRKAAFDAGANAFLHKAFDLDQYGRDIQDQLERWVK
ncbi:MAG TPA: response regulator [Nitrospirota bacterium]